MDNYEKSLQELQDKCNSMEEMTAVKKCLDIVKQNQLRYWTAQDLAPKYLERNLRAYNEAMSKVDSENEKYNIHLEWRDCGLLGSEVKNVKNEILEKCDDILTKVGIGKRRRIEKYRPILTSILKTTDLRTREERLDDTVWHRMVDNLFFPPK